MSKRVTRTELSPDKKSRFGEGLKFSGKAASWVGGIPVRNNAIGRGSSVDRFCEVEGAGVLCVIVSIRDDRQLLAITASC